MTFTEVPATVPIVHQKRRYTLSLGGGNSLGLGERTLVMGVLNVTPDSFSDGGTFTPQPTVYASAGIWRGACTERAAAGNKVRQDIIVHSGT